MSVEEACLCHETSLILESEFFMNSVKTITTNNKGTHFATLMHIDNVINFTKDETGEVVSNNNKNVVVESLH